MENMKKITFDIDCYPYIDLNNMDLFYYIEEILEIELINAKDDDTKIQMVIPFSGTTVFKYDAPHQQKIEGSNLRKAFTFYMTKTYSENVYKITSNPDRFSTRGLISSGLAIPI